MSNNLAIIGASYLQLPLIVKAKEMGYTTHVFAWATNDVGEKEADVFYPISIIEKEAILDICRKLNISGICSIASDVAVLTVNYVAEHLGLAGNSYASALKSTNKHLMRRAFELREDPSPRSILVDSRTNLASLELNFPVIVKPTDRSGSRGICKLDTYEGLQDAVSTAMTESFENKALVEEFVFGEEYSVEYISYKGQHFFLAVTQKYTTGSPHFIEKGHREPAPLDNQTIQRIQNIIPHALDTLDIKYGASHSEIKIATDGTIKIIEIGARMGGDCIGSDLVRYSTGYDFVRMVIQVACGDAPDFTKVCESFPVESIYIVDQTDVDEFERITMEEPESILRVVDYHPENIGHITDSSNRAGCYIRKVLYKSNEQKA